jgi:two-component system sensor kinase FixL
MIGKTPFEKIHPDDRQRVAEQIEQMRRTGRPQTALMRVLHEDGHYIWMESAGRAVLDPATGQMTEFIVTSRDVTRRVEADQKLRRREVELAHLDRLSTIGQLASELAHELSQPLYAITNFADACLGLVDRPDELATNELRQRWLEQIGQQARRGGDVLRRITQFVRKGEMRRQLHDLNDSVGDVLAMLEFELRRHSVEVCAELPDEPLMIVGDELLIEQVLVNLIRNAEEAMDAVKPSKRRLTVRTFSEPDGVGAAVSDTGPGLPEGANLFESYFTTKPHGTGLGLAICRSTIEAHHGRIWATNNPAGGATFQFILPAAKTMAEPAAKSASLA